MYSSIVLDLDGTLLDDKKSISNLTIEYLINMDKKGINIIVASGRNYLSIKKVFNSYPSFSFSCIALNGGEVIDKNGNLLFRETISIEKVLKVISTIKSYDLIYQIFTDQGILVNKKSDIQEEMLNFGKLYYDNENDIMKEAKIFYEIIYANNILLSNSQIIEKVKNFKLEIFKIVLLSYKKSLLEKVYKLVENIEEISLVSSHLVNLEILPFRVDKLNGLKILMKNYKLKREEIVAFGDNLNDYQMIKFVGRGVVMKNAINELKEIADRITDDNNNEGVLKELKKIFK